MTTTPNMNLVKPVPGVTPGISNSTPLGTDYANINNAALDRVDTHDHTSTNGVQVPTAGLNINSDLPINSNNVVGITGCYFNPLAAPNAAATAKNTIYCVNGDLYYNSGAGTAVKVTNGGVVNSTTVTSLLYAPYLITANLTILPAATYNYIEVNTSAARIITMPTVGSVPAGSFYYVKDVSGFAATNLITIATQGGNTIDGAATATLGTNFGAWLIVSDGTSWFITSSYVPYNATVAGTYTVKGALTSNTSLTAPTATIPTLAGAVSVGGALSAPSLTLSGALSAASLTTSGAATVNTNLTVSGGATITGNVLTYSNVTVGGQILTGGSYPIFTTPRSRSISRSAADCFQTSDPNSQSYCGINRGVYPDQNSVCADVKSSAYQVYFKPVLHDGATLTSVTVTFDATNWTGGTAPSISFPRLQMTRYTTDAIINAQLSTSQAVYSESTATWYNSVGKTLTLNCTQNNVIDGANYIYAVAFQNAAGGIFGSESVSIRSIRFNYTNIVDLRFA
jgi:hypothetical protein